MEQTSKSPLFSFILFIIVVSIVNSVQQMISPNLLAIAQYFGFGTQTTQLGVLTFAFTMVTGGVMLIFGYLADKLVRKWIVFGGTLVYSIFSCLIYWVPGNLAGYYIFFVLAAGVGAGYGALIPSVFSLIGDLIKQEDRSKGYSFFSIAGLFGMVLGLGLSSTIGQTNWRLPYLIVGILGLINTALLLRFQEPSRVGKDMEGTEYPYRIKREDLPIILSKKSNIWLIVNFVDTIPTGIIMFLLYTYMQQIHNIPSDLTLIFLAFILLSTLVGTVVFGAMGDNMFKRGNKRARVQLALMANIVPIPFVFIGLLIPFRVPDGATIIDLFTTPGALIMLVLFSIGLFVNGAVNGGWYATVADLNLPEHRGTILATANFFDIIGKALGPLIGAVVTDHFGILIGMASSIVAWVFLPLFWISLMRNTEKDMLALDQQLHERLQELVAKK
jgi:MFS family permease